MIDLYYSYWLDEIFLAQHWNNKEQNLEMWIYYKSEDFENWVKYIYNKSFHKKIDISFNIVVNKINIFDIYSYILYLKKVWFLKILPMHDDVESNKIKKISFWLVQPNWYAEINSEKVLLKYDELEVDEIHKIIDLCIDEYIYPDFHFTAPPLCILDIPDYNLEHHRMKKLNNDIKEGTINKWNLESYKYLWKEKSKIDLCKKCRYNDSCLWFYNNWIKFVWKDYIEKKVSDFISK